MKYHALACDYDGTLASNGVVDEKTSQALGLVKASGRKLFLVTGRLLEELMSLFPAADLFERIIAENGALLYRPATGESTLLGAPPPNSFVELLRRRGVQPLFIGRVILATREPHEATVLEAIHQLGLELQIIFNKGAVMVLPTGVNKAKGLEAALKEMELLPSRVVGVGDAENDHAFLELCGCSVAVANALPAIKKRAGWVTASANGAGVRELIEQLLADSPG